MNLTEQKSRTNWRSSYTQLVGKSETINYKVSDSVKIKVKIVGATVHIHLENSHSFKFQVVGNTAVEVHRYLWEVIMISLVII